MGIPFDFFLKSVGLMVIVVVLSIVKVYISNQIYYKSRTINKLESEVSALKEENSILSMNIEKLRYKTEILDSLEIEDKDNQLYQKENTPPKNNSNPPKEKKPSKSLNLIDIHKLFNKTNPKDSNKSQNGKQ